MTNDFLELESSAPKKLCMSRYPDGLSLLFTITKAATLLGFPLPINLSSEVCCNDLSFAGVEQSSAVNPSPTGTELLHLH